MSSRKLEQITPVYVEVQTGDDLAPELEKAYGGVTPQRSLNQYLTSTGNGLVRFSKRPDFPHKFQVLETNKVSNAFALGNGNVYVTKGLLNLLQDEAELAAIVGHEIGHVSNRHIAKRIDQAVGLSALAAIAEMIFRRRRGEKISRKDEERIQAIRNISVSLIVNGYSREHELEADEDGLDFAVRAGYDPWGSVRVFRAFQALEPEVRGLDAFFRSHPIASRRIGVLEAEIRRKYRGVKGQEFKDRYESIVFEKKLPPGVIEELAIAPVAAAAGFMLVPLALAVFL